MCCLRFENEEYTRMRKDLPKMNSIVSYQGEKISYFKYECASKTGKTRKQRRSLVCGL